MKLSSQTKPRLVLYVRPEEMKAAKAMAAKNGFRTPQQWAVSVVIKALVLK